MSTFAVGLDLGQATDYSALAVVERVRVLPPGMSFGHWERHTDQQHLVAVRDELRVRHLARWELGTPYDAVAGDVAAVMATPQLEDALLFYDATGVGRAVKDVLWQQYAAGRMGYRQPVGVTITGADRSHGFHVTKRDLVTVLQLTLQRGQLRIAAGLPLGDTLERELTTFRQKISTAGRDSYDIARREGEGHGDLATALMLAAWGASRYTQDPELVEAG